MNYIGYYIKVLQYTACFVVNPITVDNFDFLFYCLLVGQTSDSMTVPTLGLNYRWDGWGLVHWLLSGPWRFNYWISFAPIFSFVYCLAIIFALSPFYILFLC